MIMLIQHPSPNSPNILNGNHILGACIGAAISMPLTAWIFYAVGGALAIDVIRAPFPILVTVISAFMVVYATFSFLICWILGGSKDMF
jgi:polyferredoxin